MVLSGTVRGSDARARLVGRDAYIAAGGRVERELFDDDDSESWVDVALLETLASEEMERRAKALAAEQGLAWVKPTLDAYASHDLVEGLVRLPAEPAPLTDAELARLDELDASYDEHTAILEDEDSAEEAIAAAEATIEAIERECQDIRAKPPELAPELKADAGMILVLSRDGTPVLQPVFYGERDIEVVSDEDVVEVVASVGSDGKRRAAFSKRLVDELAMQRRDVLALHVASDPGLSLDIMVFTLADADTHDWRSRPATTLRGGVPAGPIVGFEAKDAPASASLADLRSGLDESWRSGEDASSRFKMFRALADECRAAWLGFVVARTLEATSASLIPFKRFAPASPSRMPRTASIWVAVSPRAPSCTMPMACVVLMGEYTILSPGAASLSSIEKIASGSEPAECGLAAKSVCPLRLFAGCGWHAATANVARITDRRFMPLTTPPG